jgi:hypothetical protein
VNICDTNSLAFIFRSPAGNSRDFTTLPDPHGKIGRN